ncbi:PH domain-containing protein [Flavobacterium sp.]|uniref:PH domain-containing protein n=1 Tax=Flavobacterium sp. TaxID=239 RepID=UPI002631C426|nr:PH domain-containing protein [Flavobacterium sp.]
MDTDQNTTTMESFTNTSIDTRELPRFEAVDFEPLQADYKKVIFFNTAVFALILIGILGAFLLINPDLVFGTVLLIGVLAIVFVIIMTLVIALVSFRKKGFAFRQHDVLFKSGVIATTIIVIPYNRVQHVALHEGPVSRKLDLATIEIFTAGGSGSDIRIAGLRREQADRIKQLIMAKLIEEIPSIASENNEVPPVKPAEDEL